jgi:hypothetical protein
MRVTTELRPGEAKRRHPGGLSRFPASGRGRAALVWGLGLFVAAQLGFVAVKEFWRPDLGDPEYGLRLARLRSHLARSPADRPVIIALGSSRVGVGFRPDVVAASQPGAAQPAVAFNCALAGSTPLLELCCLRRLLADGVHPDLVLVEVWPPVMSQLYHAMLEKTLESRRLRWGDLALFRRNMPSRQQLKSEWCKEHLLPWFSHRFVLLNQWAPSWLPASLRSDKEFRHLDDGGCFWVRSYETHQPDVFRSRLVLWHDVLTPFMKYPCVSPVSDQSYHELLDVCREQHIAVVLVFMPHTSAFQGWYSPETSAEVDQYLRRLTQEYGVPLIDARDWMADEDFSDSHHLTRSGAVAFTRRLDQDVLQPFLREYSRAAPAAAVPPKPTPEGATP